VSKNIGINSFYPKIARFAGFVDYFELVAKGGIGHKKGPPKRAINCLPKRRESYFAFFCG
jgi:hypothetical protein